MATGGEGGAAAVSADGDWEKHVDDASSSTYYYNRKTGESSWEAPSGVEFVAATVEEQATESHTKPPKWRRYTDDESGRTYYHDKANNVTRWESPEEAVASGSSDDEEEEEDHDNKSDKEDTKELGEEGADGDQGEKQSKDADSHEPATEMANAEGDEGSTASSPAWIKYVDATTGKAYYHNASTGKTQWDEPESFEDAPTAGSGAAAQGQAAGGAGADYQAFVARSHSERLSRVTQQVMDPSGNLTKLNAILSSIDGGKASGGGGKAGDADDGVEPPAKSEWQQHVDPHTQRYYYHNVVTGVTQWVKPDSPIVSGLADWVPPEIPDEEEDAAKRKTVSGVNYVSTAKFNTQTGKYEQIGGDDYWHSVGAQTDRAGRQMSHFFNMDDLERNRAEAQHKKEALKRKNINWKKLAAEKKAKKQKQKNEWLYTD